MGMVVLRSLCMAQDNTPLTGVRTPNRWRTLEAEVQAPLLQLALVDSSY